MEKDIVKIKCYGKIEEMEKEEAKQKFFEGMLCCEGSEKERYTNIYIDLVNGKKFCSDKVD